MKKSTSNFRNGARLRQYLGGKTYDEAVSLATCLIISYSTAYRKLMEFVDQQHPSDEYQAAYYFDSVARLVALTDEEATDFANKNRASQGYVRMCKLARAIRSIINSEEADA